MKTKVILKVQGILLVILTLAMIFPLIFSFYYNEGSKPIIESMSITLAFGIFLTLFFKVDEKVGSKEGFAGVTLGWIIVSIFGALPFYFSGYFGGFINSFFESMSGFTTTGSTILSNIEIVPKAILLWRSETQWLGGMGIVLLTIAIFPSLKIQVSNLYSAEVPGPTKDRITPKLKDTAKLLWLIYTFLTMLETIFLMLGGNDFYTAISHSFATLATGGFSTYNSSVTGFHSLYTEIIIMIFMYLAGINFLLHFYILKGRIKDFFNDKEFRFYTFVLFISTLLITFSLYFSKIPKYTHHVLQSLRDAAFQVISITTTTGFATADYNLWPVFTGLILIVLMFFGGCAGSTGGGIKQIRIMVMLKEAGREIKKLIYPKGIFVVKIGKEPVKDNMIRNVMSFLFLFILTFVFVTLFLSFRGYDIITCFSASIAALGNIGPGLARVGAVENFNFFDPISKIILAFAMLLGRLEIYSVLIFLFTFIKKDKV